MYKVMLIDDEQAVRKLMRLKIHWESYQMEVAGEAASGIEALNIIDEIRPDICFVDIRMPFMDGIEFARIAIRRYPKLLINMLTAYDDFSYARECIGVGICDYHLKPIVIKDIHEALEKMQKKLNQEKTEESEENNGKELSSIESITDFIKVHMKEPDLNLGKVAMEFGFNSSYLSRKFKNETGDSFVDYLNHLRMEKAKQYAALEKPMYQIAMEVGIPDPNYFSKCFKKYVNMTYTEYCSQQKA
ncbi:MAG: response regulator [Lachnospiraceae bacterium]|nr:response regulator [Lachnospiraceae bacterium]